MGVKTIAVKCPAVKGNRYPELILFVAFSPQRRKSKSLSDAIRQQRTGHRRQRRRLIEPAVESAQHPVELRHTNSGAKPGISGVFRYRPAKMRQPDAGVQGQPGSDLDLIFQEERDLTAGRRLPLAQRQIAPVRCGQTEETAIALFVTVYTDAGIMALCDRAEHDLRSCVLRVELVQRAQDRIMSSAQIIGAIEMIEGRHSEQQARRGRVDPG